MKTSSEILDNYKRSLHNAYITDTPKMAFVADERVEQALCDAIIELVDTPLAVEYDDPIGTAKVINRHKAELRQSIRAFFNQGDKEKS